MTHNRRHEGMNKFLLFGVRPQNQHGTNKNKHGRYQIQFWSTDFPRYSLRFFPKLTTAFLWRALPSPKLLLPPAEFSLRLQLAPAGVHVNSSMPATQRFRLWPNGCNTFCHSAPADSRLEALCAVAPKAKSWVSNIVRSTLPYPKVSGGKHVRYGPGFVVLTDRTNNNNCWLSQCAAILLTLAPVRLQSAANRV